MTFLFGSIIGVAALAVGVFFGPAIRVVLAEVVSDVKQDADKAVRQAQADAAIVKADAEKAVAKAEAVAAQAVADLEAMKRIFTPASAAPPAPAATT